MPRFIALTITILLFITACSNAGNEKTEASKSHRPPIVAVAKAAVEDLSAT